MREEIRRERTVELALEGFRIDDLKRWYTASTEMPQDQLGVKYTGTWFENNWSKQTRSLNSDGCIILYTGRQWEEKNYLYPLPSGVSLHPSMTPITSAMSYIGIDDMTKAWSHHDQGVVGHDHQMVKERIRLIILSFLCK